MRNLKKILALVLALVMSMSLVAVANAKFDDVDEDSTYAEAIEVMNAVGILEGMPEGGFDPEGTLTRAQGAKLIAYALLGEDVAEALPKDITNFSDVKSGNWAAGYIAYANAEGIIDGVGNGKFDPSGELTGYAYGKLLLTALGVDGEYTGSNWQVNVATALRKADGLMDKMSGVVLSQPLTRAQAAQLTFNAINYAPNGSSVVYVVVGPDGNQVGNTTYASFIEAYLVADNMGTGYRPATVPVRTGSWGADNFGLSESRYTDAFGRASKSWQVDGKDIVVLDRTPSKTYNTRVTSATIGRDMGITSVNTAYTLNVSVNGGAVESKVYTRGDKTPAVWGGAGTLTEVYKDEANDTVFNVFVIDTYVYELATSGNVFAAKAATATADADPAHILVPNPYGDGTLRYNTDAFKAGNVILYTANVEGVVDSVVLAPTISGVVTAVSADKNTLTVNGTRYARGAKAQNSVPETPSAQIYTFYTDSSNNLMLAKEGAVSAEYDTSYVYVIQRAAKGATPTDGSDLFGTGASSTAAQAQAKIIDVATGEIKIVNEALAQDTNGTWYYAGTDGAFDSSKPVTTTTTGIQDVGKLYVCTVLEDGSYVLINERTPVSVAISGGSTSVTSSGLFANNATKVTKLELTKNGTNVTKASVTTYTGYSNFPGYTGMAVVDKSNTSNLVTSILYVTDYVAPTTHTYGVYAGPGEYVLVNGTVQQLHAFYVNGEAVSYSLDAGVGTLTVGNVYDISVSNNVVKTANDITSTMVNGTVTYVDDELIAVGNGSALTLADNCKVYDKNANYALGTVAVGNMVNYHTTTANGRTVVDLIIVVG